jgi:hypothetical protein
MPVVHHDRRLVGIVALGDFATDDAPGTEEALRRISSPSEPDRSGTPSTARAEESRRAPREPLTEDERRELERRGRERERGEDDRFGAGPADVGSPRGDLQDFPSDYAGYGSGGPSDEEVRRARRGSGEGWRNERPQGFRFRDEDDRRAAFPGGFNEPYGEGGRPGRMRGGYGGEGYAMYGGAGARGAQGRGAQGGGGPRYDDFGGHGSRRSGAPRRLGTEGEENYDRGIRSGREDYAPWGGNRFSNETYGYWREGGRHRGRGPKNLARSNERIREDVCERLLADPEVDASDIEVRVENGEVTLEGAVRNRREKRLAEDIAYECRGVHDVHNRLLVAPDDVEVHIGKASE